MKYIGLNLSRIKSNMKVGPDLLFYQLAVCSSVPFYKLLYNYMYNKDVCV